ncbi:PREDICTED: cell division cycle-associated protein 2, partial [Sturnus vulgaris]|uniref:cell division cycle-associated protein 2 n=1 Tax=Sturnus vulgaris TaxID=9172 RepID=UPI00071A242D
MLRGSKTPLKVKENESGCPEKKEKSSFPPSRDPKSCKVTKSKAIRTSKKENFTDGNQTQPPKRALKCPKSLKQNLGCSQGVDGSCFGVSGGDLLTEPPLPLHTKEDFPSSRATPLGNDFITPERDKVEGNPDFGVSEERRKTVDFTAVISAEFGIAQESFGKRPSGTSPASLKFRRRSTIGLRGSPENNSLIRYLAQQRSSRHKEAFTQISPFKPANVRSLKDKIDAFQASFESLQEAEGEPSKDGDSSQDKAPFKKEPNLEQWSEKFMLGNRGAALKENLSENGNKSSRSELRICSILSPERAVTVTDPAAAAKEWVSEQQNPIKSLETVLTGDTLDKGHVPRCDHSGCGSDAVSDPSTRKAETVEDESLGVLGGNQGPVTPLRTGDTEDESLGMLGTNQGLVTPLRTGDIPSCALSQSSSLLRSILKKTPGKELRDCPKEYSNNAIDRGGDESAAFSNCVKTFKTLQTETTDIQSSKTPKKKKVTFGEVLSPEIFDQSLPANTPLRRGASPGCPQGQSPWARPGLSGEPLPLLDFGWDEEGVETLPEFLEGSAAAQAPSPVENAEVIVAETDKPDITCSSTKRKGRAVAEDSEGSSSGATDTESAQIIPESVPMVAESVPMVAESVPMVAESVPIITDSPRKSKIQKQKNPTTAAPKRTKKTKYPGFGKRRKKRVKKSLYGEREMASKKPLLSPIPEIPEVFSSASSPNSPLFTEGAGLGNPKCRGACRDRDTPQQPQAARIRAKGLCAAAGCPKTELLEEAAATSSGPGVPEVPGSLECAPGTAAQFSNAVPHAEGDFDAAEYFQQGEETPCDKEAKESSSLLEKEELEGNLLTGLEILDQQERTKCPQKDSVRGDPARRRRRRSSSSFYFPPVENMEITGADLCSYNVEEVLSVSQAHEGSLQGCRR